MDQPAGEAQMMIRILMMMMMMMTTLIMVRMTTMRFLSPPRARGGRGAPMR
jgi:hypothetical protein